MSLFSKQNTPLPPNEETPYHPIWSNFGFLFITNFKLIPFFLPSFICLYLFLIFGGLIFLAGALLLLLPAGPAVAAMYDIGYQLARELDKHERRSFFQSYRENLGQGIATMAVQLPVIAMLLMLMLTQVEKPVWVTICLILGGVMLMAFSILAFSQVALVALPLKEIWKNALLLIPLCSWRGIAAAVVQLLYLAALYQWLAATFLFFLFMGPAMLIAWSSSILWPKLESLLLNKEN